MSHPDAESPPAVEPAVDPTSAVPEVSIIVVSYNTRDLTLACLRSVLEQTTSPFELIVIDNASTDGSAEALAEAYPAGSEPRVRLILEDTNHGFAKANNLAAVEARGAYLLLLNPDTVVLDAAIDNLLAFAKRRPDDRIWGGRTRFGDGSLNATSCWRKMTLWTIFCRTTGLTGLFRRSELFNPESYGDWQRDTERSVDIVTGCFFLIPRDFWNRLGGFDLAYVMYGEEADLCLRAMTFGARPSITPAATIIHYGGASETVRTDRMVRILRAKATLIRRHFSPGTRSVGLLLFQLWPLTRAIAGRFGIRKRGSETGGTWLEIWRRRGEWVPGYPQYEAAAPTDRS